MSRQLLQMRRDFCKDYKMPIPVVEDPYFEYYLDLYEEHLGARTKYEKMSAGVNRVGYQDYRISLHNLKDAMLKQVKNTPEYVAFNDMDIEYFRIDKRPYKQDNVTFYSIDHCDRKWISVDLVTANFHALRYVDPAIVGGHDTYEEFVNTFEGSEFVVDAKPLRQMIFGNLNPKRQQVVQKYMLHQLMLDFSEAFPDVVFHGTTADEFLVEYSVERLAWLEANQFLYHDEKDTRYKVVVFELFKTSDWNELGFHKRFLDGSTEIVSVAKMFYAQAYKYLHGLEVEELDLYFVNENHVAKFLKPLMESEVE